MRLATVEFAACQQLELFWGYIRYLLNNEYKKCIITLRVAGALPS
jgi:hypothetical protein